MRKLKKDEKPDDVNVMKEMLSAIAAIREEIAKEASFQPAGRALHSVPREYNHLYTKMANPQLVEGVESKITAVLNFAPKFWHVQDRPRAGGRLANDIVSSRWLSRAQNTAARVAFGKYVDAWRGVPLSMEWHG